MDDHPIHPIHPMVPLHHGTLASHLSPEERKERLKPRERVKDGLLAWDFGIFLGKL